MYLCHKILAREDTFTLSEHLVSFPRVCVCVFTVSFSISEVFVCNFLSFRSMHGVCRSSVFHVSTVWLCTLLLMYLNFPSFVFCLLVYIRFVFLSFCFYLNRFVCFCMSFLCCSFVGSCNVKDFVLKTGRYQLKSQS